MTDVIAWDIQGRSIKEGCTVAYPHSKRNGTLLVGTVTKVTNQQCHIMTEGFKFTRNHSNVAVTQYPHEEQ